MRFPVKEGQQIFIVTHDKFVNREARTFKGEITKVNTISFYVKTCSRERELRFDKKTGISDGITCYYKAYPDRETYESLVKRIERERQLQCEIGAMISGLDLDDLLKIKGYVNEIIKGVE
ncbi:hypothetical protein [Tissierella pigra]|uniref:Uncharacterized protein n=1 Tax=Tissierella pigra TaxID=2607614 RepID=A0A6N7XIM6_9FIRM|nr:hypothetical protein [Tissierella pigra]MSU01889.1 hypothetical protein [Tissierella pigra]